MVSHLYACGEKNSSNMGAPLQVIVHPSDPCENMAVISKGLVGCRGRLLREGDSFGEETVVMEAVSGAGHDI